MVLPVVFPLVGATRVRDTFNAPRDGGARVHMGVDLPLLARRHDRDAEYPVRAPVPGRILRISKEGPIGEPNEGNAVFIRDADGWTHLLAHLKNPLPDEAVGMEVQAGDFMGLASNTGNARNTGPHLHYHIVDDRGRRVNPTSRLAMLHAALEASRTEPLATATGRRVLDAAALEAANERMREQARNRRLPSSVQDLTPEQESDLEERPRRPMMQSSIATAPRPRTSVTPEEGERARESVRTARQMVKRAAEESLDVEPWEEWVSSYALGGRYTREQRREQEMLRTVVGPIILEHLRRADVAMREAEQGGENAGLRWVEAFEQLQGAHRLTQSLVSPWESLRGDPIAAPLWPVLEAVDMADQALEMAMQTHEALVAFGAETWDDMGEAAGNQGTFGLGLVLLGIAGLWAWSRGRRA